MIGCKAAEPAVRLDRLPAPRARAVGFVYSWLEQLNDSAAE